MPRRIQIIAADAVNRQLLQALLGGAEAVLEKAPAAPPEEGSVPPDAPPLSLHRLSGPEGRKTGVWLCETGALSALEGRPAYILALTDPGSGWTEGAPRCSEEALRQALAGWGRRVCIYNTESCELTMPAECAQKHGLSRCTLKLPGWTANTNALAEDSRAPLASFFQAICRGEKSASAEVCALCADGMWHWERMEFARISGAAPSAGGIITVEDTTLLHQREEERRRHKENESVLRLVAEQSRCLIYRYDIRTRTAWADASAKKRGWLLPEKDTPEAAVARGEILPESVDEFFQVFREIERGTPSGGAKLHLRNDRAGACWVDLKYSLVPSGSQPPKMAVLSFLNITENHEKELAYHRYLQNINENMSAEKTMVYLESDITTDTTEKYGGVMICKDCPDIGCRQSLLVEYICKNYIAEEDWRHCREFLSSEHLMRVFADGVRTLAQEWNGVFEGETDTRFRAEVQMVQDPYTGHLRAYTLIRNVTAERQEALALRRQAELDGMTGLLNKTAVEEQIADRLHLADRANCALLVVDLDNLKMLNDTLGHDQGDRAIRMLGSILREQFRRSDLVGRAGGDEFVVFLDHCGDEAWLACAVTAFLRRISGMRVGTQNELPLRCSVGVAEGISGVNTYEELFRRADKALYHVKRNGKNDFAFYIPEMEQTFYSFRGHPAADTEGSILSLTARESASLLYELRQVFDVVRIVDAERMDAYTMSDGGTLLPAEKQCCIVWNRSRRCENCISRRALRQRTRLTKYEYIDEKLYLVVAKYIEIDGKPFVLETVANVTGQISGGLSAGALETLSRQESGSEDARHLR